LARVARTKNAGTRRRQPCPGPSSDNPARVVALVAGALVRLPPPRLYFLTAMDPKTYSEFSSLRASFRSDVVRWSASAPGLAAAQRELIRLSGRTPYPVETPIVYNERLDDVTAESEIRYLIVADNPGIREQRAVNRRYLVGQSGKLARSFFAARRGELGADFDTGTIILNKTPIHTPRTADLRSLPRAFFALLEETQVAMAAYCLAFHRLLGCELWIVGYGELKEGKVFHPFASALKAAYTSAEAAAARKRVFVFRHFSMNQFSIDLARKSGGRELKAALEAVGAEYRLKYLGW
jgi:hypothetical protein